jgi:erythromycin esterase-like protein
MRTRSVSEPGARCMREHDILEVLRRGAVWFEPTIDGFGSLLDSVGDASLVLIGEASHGTHEFYRTRAELTKALLRGKRFNIVAVEADWPDAYRANRWVRHASNDPDAETALGDFTRFPRWMWRNRDVVEFMGWLRSHNASLDPSARVGFYGLDLYSLHTSIEAVLAYLRKVDPAGTTRHSESAFDRRWPGVTNACSTMSASRSSTCNSATA